MFALAPFALIAPFALVALFALFSLFAFALVALFAFALVAPFALVALFAFFLNLYMNYLFFFLNFKFLLLFDISINFLDSFNLLQCSETQSLIFLNKLLLFLVCF